MNAHPNPKPNSPAKPTWTAGFRGLVSVLLVIHLTALFVGPCASPPPSSEWARRAEGVMEPYLNLVFLKDHGYRFFAPNPGPSHLVRYELYDEDDNKIDEAMFPSLEQHWPRLLYHRHFMISESLFNIANIPDQAPPPEAPAPVKADYERARNLRDTYLNSLSRHLANLHPEAAKIRLVMVEHMIPLPEDVARGMPLSDPSMYIEQELGWYTVESEEAK